MTFAAPDLPPRSGHGITVTHRGTQKFTNDQIRSNGGEVALVIQ
jgi:hypothetical protein